MMKFRVIRPQTPNPAQSPIRIVEQASGREVGWVNRYPDREYVRRVAGHYPAHLRLQPPALCSLVGESSSFRRRG